MLIPFDQLFKRHGVRPRGVLHLGANEGQEAKAYNDQGIDTVIWVEALPDVCAKLRKEIEPYPGQVAICACVANIDGAEVQFNVASNQGQSSSLLEFGTHAQKHPTVRFTGKVYMRTVRVDTLLVQKDLVPERRGWFLNADLQGAELLALQGMERTLPAFDWAYIEVNRDELYKGCALVGDVDEFMSDHGFLGVEEKWTGFGWGDKFYRRMK